MSRNHLSATVCILIAFSVSLTGCGGGSSSPGAPPSESVSVAVTAAREPIVQVGAVLPIAASVTPSSANQNITWKVNDVAGGNATVGTVTKLDPTSSALVFSYTPPAVVADTTDIRLTATSAADPTKSASLTVTVFAKPRIGTRINNVSLNAEFYDRATGQRFIPRGMNYVRLTDHLIVPPVNQVMPFHGVFGPGLYDSTRVETALAAMENSGYNLVRVWLDPQGAIAGVGNPNGSGLSTAYMANLADFVRRAKSHNLYVTVTTDDLPRVGGYQETIDPVCKTVWPACWNLEYTKSTGITAGTKFWRDFITALAQQHAPMDAIFSYQLREEFFYPGQNAGDINLPLLPSSGMLTAANGKTYDMGNPAQRQACMNESLIYWTDQLRGSIQVLAPGAVVGVGFVTGANPYVPPFIAIANSRADYIDGHTGPGEGTTLTQDMNGWGMPFGFNTKPVIMGEFAARTATIPLESDAANALKAWQVESCNFGIQGWALWSWDTAEHDTLGFPHWYALRGTGLVNAALAPANRPDPCQN